MDEELAAAQLAAKKKMRYQREELKCLKKQRQGREIWKKRKNS